MEKHFQIISLFAFYAIVVSSNNDCHVICNFDGERVCGFNGDKFEEFTNLCYFKLQTCQEPDNWELTSNRDCGEQSPSKNQISCPIPCPRNFAPICGFDGIEYRVFSNECMMRSQKCDDEHEWKRVVMKSCSQISDSISESLSSSNCPRICHADNNPVCGFNGKRYQIFGNQCEFNQLNCNNNYEWKLTRLSECHEELLNKSECNPACPDNYEPMCGFNGRTYKMFANECEFKLENCLDKEEGWELKRLADCNV